jgi:hypothetical protein
VRRHSAPGTRKRQSFTLSSCACLLPAPLSPTQPRVRGLSDRSSSDDASAKVKRAGVARWHSGYPCCHLHHLVGLQSLRALLNGCSNAHMSGCQAACSVGWMQDSEGGNHFHGLPVHQVEGRRRGPGPRSVRIQSRLRLRLAMRPTARTRSWLAHCSGQRGPEPQHSKAARRYEAPSEPRPTASKRRPVCPPRSTGTRARRDDGHSVAKHADSE